MAGITALDLNPYLYCANNPINRLDPDGKSWLSSAINYVKNTVSKVVKAVVSVAKTVATAVSNTFNEIGDDMMVGLNGYASSKNKYIRNAANAVNNAADKYGGNWGSALAAGITFSAIVIGSAALVGYALDTGVAAY